MNSLRASLVGSAVLVCFLSLAPQGARAQGATACNPTCLTGEVCVAGTCMTPACRPACAAGETCVSGTCMVPAARSAEPQRPPAELPPPAVEPPRSDAPPPSGEPRAAPQAVEATEPQYVPTTGRHGAVLVPQIGVSSFLEEEARYLGPGLRVGGLAGAHLTNEVSLGGALAFDLLNWDPPPGGSASGFMLEAAFTPLFHAGDQRAEFVVGPAIGAWMASSTFKDDVFGDSGSATAQGWALGGNMGLFAPVSKSVRVGALINFMVRDTLHACATLNAQSNCAKSGPAHQVIGFTAAAML